MLLLLTRKHYYVLVISQLSNSIFLSFFFSFSHYLINYIFLLILKKLQNKSIRFISFKEKGKDVVSFSKEEKQLNQRNYEFIT